MQPQQPQGQVGPPNPNYDFIFKDGQKPKKGLSLPSMNLPKPVAITLAIVVGLVVLIIASSLLFGSKGSKYQDLTDLMNRQQEIIRVTAVALPSLSDPAAKALAATTTATMTSEQSQMTTYLKARGTKVDPKTLTKYLNKNTDSQLQVATQNNTVNTAYEAYLKSSFAVYRSSLNTAYKTAPASAKSILSSAYSSVGTLLSDPPLAN